MGAGENDMISNIRWMCIGAEIELVKGWQPPVTKYVMESLLQQSIHMRQ